MVKYTGRRLVVKRPGVRSKVQMLDLVLGVGVFSLLPKYIPGVLEKFEENSLCSIFIPYDWEGKNPINIKNFAGTPPLLDHNHQRIAKGAGGKGPRQKTSKIVNKCQKVFRHFSTIFAQGKKRQKSSKSVKKFSTLFDNFRAAPFSGPFCNPLT